ncbi:MAG: 4-hydroxy-tetrahydrodipicolinate synthase [Bacteroidetes bacterium]|nr:MAG: 4-hydroxy-tetrahydrodipicolinate synthase [Bacteroidota bacterium]MBL1145340.1 4-hydroxy-tetrahydrodipicolinate synthase [Bacteroidota bacterium]NOG58138.1 4-hydroxy-tetrahydrodipicolinate synthase [Bacteroidota bacterium]
MEALKGTGVALVTPFNSDGTVDFVGLTALVEHVIQGGLDFLVVLGTTGETATLEMDEQIAILSHVKKVNNARRPIVLGIGGNNTAQVISNYQSFDLEGVTAILTASPYYNKPTQEGIYQHYKAIASISSLPILLYNVPGRTASNMTAQTTLRLANDFENIIGIKEASANMDQVMQILKNKPDNFFLTSGEDALAFPISILGGVGVISVVANAYPKQYSDMIRASLMGDLATARNLHYQLLDFTNLMFEEGNPGGIKAALKHLSVCNDYLRLPLWRVSDCLNERIQQAVKEIS